MDKLRTDIYEGNITFFDHPKIIGYIGLENLKFAKFMHEGKVTFDLNLHYDKAVHKPQDRDMKLTKIQKFLLENEERLNYPHESSLDMSQIISYRGLMARVACTPYEKQEPWRIVAVLFKGNIYLCCRDTDYNKERRQNKTDEHKLFTSWGYKFKQYMLLDKPDSEPNPDEPVDENEEFSLMFTTKLNNHRIVYGAEMDGIRCDLEQVSEPPSQDHGVEAIVEYLSTKEFVELKTTWHIQHPNQERSFRRFRTMKWWCQTVFVGVNSIVCGFRNEDGIVEQLKIFNAKELPKHKLSQKYWNTGVCFNFLDNFLTFVKHCLARKIQRLHGDRALKDLQSLPIIDILFEFNPERKLVEVDETYVYKDDQILQDWFIQNYGKINV